MNAVPRPWLLTLAALSALATLSTNILLPSLPVIAQSLGVDEARLTAGVLGLFLAGMTTTAATLPGARMDALAMVLAGGGLLALLSGTAKPAVTAVRAS